MSELLISLNEYSDKKNLTVSNFINEIKKGKKYRLRANTKLGNKIVLKEPMRNNYLLRDGKVTIYHSLKIEWRVDFPKESHILIQEIDHTGFSLGLLKDAQPGDLELFVSSTFELGPGDVFY